MAVQPDAAAWTAALARLSSDDFERLLARHYWAQGYEVEHVGTDATGSRFDGGVDLVLHRDGDRLMVQCKHWKTAPVAAEDVNQLQHLLESRRGQRAILVISGVFTDSAREAAAKSGRIDLVDGEALRAMIDGDDVAALTADSVPRSRWWVTALEVVAVLGLGWVIARLLIR